MSYDVNLLEPVGGEVIEFESIHQIRGGTYRLGGTPEAHLNITHNYAPHFRKHLDTKKGLRVLYGKTAAETISLLEQAIAALRDDKSDDYWEPTEGNAKAALLGLLAFARLRPDGVWDGD